MTEEKPKKGGIIKKTIIVISIIVGLFILFQIIRAVFLVGVVGIETEGTVQYDDCREKITIQEKDASYWFGHFGKQFTCAERKTQSGRIIGGICVLVNLDSNGACLSAYIYEKPQDPVCANSVKDGVNYPYLGYDDKCYTTSQ